jgi:hypothetical protein
MATKTEHARTRCNMVRFALHATLVVALVSDVGARLQPAMDQDGKSHGSILVPFHRRGQELRNLQLDTPFESGEPVVFHFHPPPLPAPPSVEAKEQGQPLSLAQKVKSIDFGGCFSSNTQLVFDSPAVEDYFEGGFSRFGTRKLWSGRRLSTLDNSTVGTSSGSCTVIAEALDAQEAEALCSLHYHFTNGPLAGSTLTSTGIYKGSQASGIGEYTITSGTGCFAGSQGLILQTLMGGSVVRSSIGLE